VQNFILQPVLGIPLGDRTMQKILFSATALLAVSMLSGCIAHFRHASEERFSTAPDMREPCRQSWSVDRAYFRVEDHNGFAWTDAANRGFPGLRPILTTIVNDCPAAATRTAAPAQATATSAQTTPTAPKRFNDPAVARVTAHFLEYSDKRNRTGMMIPVVAFQILSVGYAPTDLTTLFAVCVEATLPDNTRRSAVAQGNLQTIANLWGGSESVLFAGGSLRQQNKEQLMSDLSRQAWHKIWAQGEALPGNVRCQSMLDGMARKVH